MATRSGQTPVVRWLLSIGVPWNALDKNHHCAGDYALQSGNQEIVDLLLDAGCRAELILSAVEKSHPSKENAFLQGGVTFHEDSIVDDQGDAVMMQWEAPLMEAHAEAMGVAGGEVLNVGFGMGLIDAAIQKRRPKRHTIIEAHPQIYHKMVEDGWTQRPGVLVIFGKWQDVLGELGTFDSIFFDTYGEHYRDLQEFHQQLKRILRPGGIYSFFNGLAPDNAFFHLVYCEIVKAELRALGLTVHLVPLPLKASDEEVWKNARRRYWWSDTYHLPVAQRDE